MRQGDFLREVAFFVLLLENDSTCQKKFLSFGKILLYG